MLNDRSHSRQEEESRYEAGRSEPLRDATAVASSQWLWVQQLLSRKDQAHCPSVLDIGCGQGAFLLAARSGGAAVAGLELDPAGVEACRRADLPVTQGSLYDVDLPAGSWDVVTLWDVLDHLERPEEGLRLLVACLAPGGLLIVRGRNARLHASVKRVYARFAGLFRRMGIPDLSVVHRWGLSPSGYVRLMRQAGLNDIHLHPGLPTPGDRYGALGSKVTAQLLKGTLRLSGMAVSGLSLRRLYPFPSVLISGRRAANE